MPKIDKMLSEITGLDISKDNLEYKIKLTEEETLKTKDYSVAQAVETIRNRLDQFGLSEPTVLRQGKVILLYSYQELKQLKMKKQLVI